MPNLPLNQIKYILLVVLYILTAWRVTYQFVSYPGFPVQNRTKLSTVLEGKEHKPFVYRLLVPSTVKWISTKIPDTWKKLLLDIAEDYKWKASYMEKIGWEKKYYFDYLLMAFVLFLLFLASLFTMRSLIYSLFEYPDIISDLAPLLNALLLPTFFVITDYFYDPGVVFFSSLMLLLIQNRSHLWFLIVFALACLNKETAILYSLVFLLKENGQMPRWRLAGWMSLFFAIAISIKWTTYLIFHDHHGNFIESHWTHNWNALIFNGSNPPYFQAAALFWGFFIFFRWNSKPIFLRRAFLVIFIPEFLLSWPFGWIDEIRIFLDAYPPMFLLGLLTIAALYEIPYKQRSEISSS